MKKTNTILLILFLTNLFSYSQTLVTTEDELNAAINTAEPGTTIMLANGIWKDIFISLSQKNGSSAAPITITAEDAGSVFMTGNSRVYMNGSYITVSGLIFQDPENLVINNSEIEPVIELKECNNCKVINNKIDTYNGTESQKALKFKWIINDGVGNEIAYNSFIGKYGIGSIINDNRNSSEEDFLTIHHNYFADRTPINAVNEDNDQDAIRIGNSETSLNDSFSEVYNNYFENFFGEVEVISNKSGNNKYYNNTFRNYAGSLTLRHGDNCEVYNNFFFAENNNFSAGVRVVGEGHKIYNNYIQDINSRKLNNDGSTSSSNATGGINVSNGRPNTEINGYYQVIDATIINNTFVNCDFALRIGTNVGDDLSLAPENLIIANNIMLNSSTSALEEQTSPSGASIYEGNITQNGNWDLTNNVNNNITVTENLLTEGDNFYELNSMSDAINHGVGTYSFLTTDILAGNRETNFDSGAEEFGAGGTQLPYTSNDVGITLGFGSPIVSNPILNTNVEELVFNSGASTTTFIVNSNVNWEITENLSWLSLSETSGSNIKEITVTVNENTTDEERTGNIIINEIDGEDDLSITINVTQSNDLFIASNAVEIPVDAVSAVGTQIIDGTIINGPENTIDGLTDTRWSAESFDGSTYLTFDLGCVHTLTDVSIYFHKSTERTTTISIATSNNGTDFNDVYTEVSSTKLINEDYEDFDMNLIEAQYIRIYGFGNSDGSAWNSIEEVKFFGNEACNDNDNLAVFDSSLESKGITIYPIPTNNKLTVASKNITIQEITIYNITGTKVLSVNAKNTYLEEINTSNLASGIYYIAIDNIGMSKFIIK